MKYYLAVDGGGSKTSVICSDESGNEVARGLSGPTSLAATSVGAASFNLREAVRQAIDGLDESTEFEALVMGLAGMDNQSEKDNAMKIFGEVLSHLNLKEFILVNDIVIALESGTDNPNALALISGTGSNCYGRNSSGQEAKTGGMDFLLTDQGSGFYIGSNLLRAVVKSYDGRGQKTIMEQLVCEYFHISSVADLKTVVYNPNLSKPEIADLGLICFQAMEKGDMVAQQIIDMAIEELILMGSTVIRKLHIGEENVACVLAGKVTTNNYVRETISNRLRSSFSNIEIVIPHQEPVYGALKMALRQNTII